MKSEQLLPSLEKKSLRSRIAAFLNYSEQGYLLYAFLIPVVLMYLIYLAMGLHPFGDGSVLVLDLNGQYVSFYEMLREAVHGDTSLIYSFERALGGEFMGIYAYYLASPFSYIVALFPRERILEALLTIFLLKSGLCGFTMGWYLHKNTQADCRNKVSIVLFSILYAMSAYCVVQQHNSMWIDAVIWLPILAYAIEQLIKHGKFKLFVIFLSLTLCSNYYIGYMCCIFVAAYFFYYFFAHNEKLNGSEHTANNPRGERDHFRKSFIRIAFYSILAIGMSSIIVFTAYYSLKFGKSTFSNPNWTPTVKFEFMAFLTKFLPGSYDTVRPEGLPFVYCGLLTVLLLPVYFLAKRITHREKIASGLFVLFFILSFVVSTLDLIWHGFQKPNWLNYRYSFMLCFILIVMAYRAFGEIRKMDFKILFAIATAMAGFVIIAQPMTFESYVESSKKLLSFPTVFLSLLCILAYLVILAVVRKSKQRESICLILAIVCCLEVYCSGLTCDVQFGADVVYTSYSRYNDYMNELRPITDAVLESDKSFYRMEKTTSRKTNDSMALNMNSLCCSTSTLNVETINFLRYMGYASKSNWSKYLGGTPVNDSLLGVKYLLSDSDVSSLYKKYSVNLDEENNYTAYLNPYALSIAFGVDDAIYNIKADSNEDYYQNYNSPMGFMNALITSMLGESSTVQVFKPINRGDPTSLVNCQKSSSAGYTVYAPLNPESDATVTFDITVPKDKGSKTEVFIFIPANEKTREVKVKVNNGSVGTFGGNETNRIVSLGTHTAGSNLKVSLTISNNYNTLYIENSQEIFYYIDTATFKDAFERLLDNPQYVVEEGYENDHLKGSIETKKNNQTIMTTIPYDEGWTVLVDGVRVDYEKAANALIAFEIETAGEHTLEFVYRPAALVLGATASVISVAFFALICLFEKKFRSFIWKGKGKTIGSTIDGSVAVADDTIWVPSFYTYDPPENEDPEDNTSREMPEGEMPEGEAPAPDASADTPDNDAPTPDVNAQPDEPLSSDTEE